jgi:hypothetical protein
MGVSLARKGQAGNGGSVWRIDNQKTMYLRTRVAYEVTVLHVKRTDRYQVSATYTDLHMKTVLHPRNVLRTI